MLCIRDYKTECRHNLANANLFADIPEVNELDWGRGIGRIVPLSLDNINQWIVRTDAIPWGQTHNRVTASTRALACPILADAVGPLSHRVIDKQAQLVVSERPAGPVFGDSTK